MGGLRTRTHMISSTTAGFIWLGGVLVRTLITGDHWRGLKTDNATMFHAATKDYRDRPYETLSGPKWQRLAKRWIKYAIPGLMFFMAFISMVVRFVYLTIPGHTIDEVPGWTKVPWTGLGLWWLLLALVGFLGHACYRGVLRWKARHLIREFIVPTAKAVANATGEPYHRRNAGKVVQLPSDFEKPNLDIVDVEPVRIALPVGKVHDEAAKLRVLSAAGKTLGMPSPRAEWQLKGASPYVLLRPMVLPPAKVTFAQVKGHFERLSIDEPLVGLAAGKEVVSIDYLNDSPHVLVSGGSGTGKSVLAKCIHSQRMHHGAGLIILDYKRWSHPWAHELPGCAYAYKIADIHFLAIAAGTELQRRIDAPEEEHEHFRTIDILVEEANSLMPQLRDYWKTIKTPEDPVASPAVQALQMLVFMGRQMRMHADFVGQRASASIFGGNGGDVRESFQTRLLAKWTKQTWNMLSGGATYQRWPGGGRGIWALIQDDEVKIVRVPFMSDAEAREWAMSGTPSPDISFIYQDKLAGRTDIKVIDAEELPPALVTLSEALPLLPGPAIALPALRKAAQRDNRFPMPVSKVGPANQYTFAELEIWKSLRDGETANDPWDEPGQERKHAVVYGIDTLHPETRQVVLGYVGQTVRRLMTREQEHREEQPWSDLIVGHAYVIWEGDPTPAELDATELALIRERKPLYNFSGQEGADHAIPKYVAVEQRHARDAAAGRAPWTPMSHVLEAR